MGCLAAQMVAKFKVGVGGFYLFSVKNKDLGQDYEYHVYKDRVVVKDYDSQIFSGTWQEFANYCKENQYKGNKMSNEKNKPITGYRTLDQTEIDLINEIKKAGIQLEKLIDSIESKEGIDLRWLSIGRTDLQKGLMSIVRAVAKPESF